jgi:hypothetical protein
MVSRQLMARICGFQGGSLREADRSRLAAALGVEPAWLPAVERLLESPRARSKFAEPVLDRLGVDPREEVDFRTPRQRLVLLGGPALVRLVELAGAGLLHAPIGRVIERAGVRRLREALGAEVYGFAVRRAPLLIGPRWPPAPWVEPELVGDLLDQVRPAGLRCLESWLSGQPRPLAARVLLKLPGDLAIDTDRPVPDSWRDRAGTVLERVARSELAEAMALLAPEEA